MRGICSQPPLRAAAACRLSITHCFLLVYAILPAAIISGCASVSVENNSPAATAKIAVLPSSVDFKSVVIGQKNSQSVKLTNLAAEPIDLRSLHVSGSGFALSASKTPVILAPGKSINLAVVFAPSKAAAASGSLVISSTDLKSPVSVPLSGAGENPAPAIQVFPASISFGSHTVHTSTSQSVTLKNTGNVSLSITSVNIAGSVFSVSGLSNGVSLAPDQKLEFQVTYHPSSAGSSSGAVTLNSASLSAPVKLAMSGSGTTASPPASSPNVASNHSVTLDWDASSSSVIGYHIYRANVSGGPYSRITNSTISSLNYRDASVFSGTRYFYVLTAVDSDGTESTYSNEASAEIPNN